MKERKHQNIEDKSLRDNNTRGGFDINTFAHNVLKSSARADLVTTKMVAW